MVKEGWQQLTYLFLIFAVLLLGALIYETDKADKEITTLTNTLTACRNTPAKLARELTKKEMAVVIARTKKDMAWRRYLTSKVPCPPNRECK